MRYLFIISCLFTASFLSAAGSLEQAVTNFTTNTSTKNAQYSIYAKYIKGPVIIDVNADARLSPASLLKLYTTAAALDILGPNTTFATQLYYDGTIKNHKLNGNIYIKGGGGSIEF